MQADDSGKYTWLLSHQGLDWDEDTWVRRLYHCLKSKETELGVTVVDVSRDGPKWEKRLKTILHDASMCTRCTHFSVTDLVLIGANGFVNVIAASGVDTYTNLVAITTGMTLLEVGTGKMMCGRSKLILPTKLGELLSSMYLLGALNALKEHTPFGKFRTFGLLIIRNNFTIGVELEVSTINIPTVHILWINFDFNRLQDELLFLVKISC